MSTPKLNEAPAKPDAGLVNNELTAEERSATRPGKLNKGPKLHDGTGAYLPAAYKTRNDLIRIDR